MKRYFYYRYIYLILQLKKLAQQIRVVRTVIDTKIYNIFCKKMQ